MENNADIFFVAVDNNYYHFLHICPKHHYVWCRRERYYSSPLSTTFILLIFISRLWTVDAWPHFLRIRRPNKNNENISNVCMFKQTPKYVCRKVCTNKCSQHTNCRVFSIMPNISPNVNIEINKPNKKFVYFNNHWEMYMYMSYRVHRHTYPYAYFNACVCRRGWIYKYCLCVASKLAKKKKN